MSAMTHPTAEAIAEIAPVSPSSLSGADATSGSRESAEPPRTAPRWGALDLFRFVAVLLMIQGHAFTTLLSSSYDSQRWLRHHNFVHGYTAPMFLFASGLAFGVTTFRGWDRQTRPGKALDKRLRRYVSLIVIGYLLHLPAFFPSDWAYVDEARWREFLHVDVLQHVGVSLALLQLAAVALKKPERLAALAAVLFLVVVLGAPILWTLPVDGVPFALSGYLNGVTGSTFALVPWAAFTWAGLLTAYAARNHPRPSHTLLGKMALATALVIFVPIAINRAGFSPYPPHDFWRSSPYYFFFRLGNVMAVLTALMAVERMVDHFRFAERFAAVKKSLSFAEMMGQESLIVYVTHLVVLHGCVLGPGLQNYWGRDLDLTQVSLVTLTLVASMGLLALGWSRLKAWNEDRKRRRLLPA